MPLGAELTAKCAEVLHLSRMSYGIRGKKVVGFNAFKLATALWLFKILDNL